MTPSTINNRAPNINFIFLLSGYFSLHILLRVLVSDSLDYDEAEQALLSQWLLPGYTEQPPLYTWVQFFLFKLFGKNVFAVSLLKNALLFLSYLFVYLSAERLLKNTRAAILATSSLLLIPQIAWESQRDMTHTTLVVFTAAAVLWLTLRLVENRTLLNYCLLGIFCGIGVLAKANFALFLTILFLTLLTLPEGRKLLFSRLIFISFALTLVISAYYFIWMFNNQDIVFSATHKFKQTVETYSIDGVGSFFTATFLFLTPLWLFYLFIFPKGYLRYTINRAGFSRRFMFRYGVIFVLTLLFVVIIFKITYVKDRWLQPLLFAAPLIFFTGFDVTEITNRKYKQFLLVVMIAVIIIYAVFTLRVVAAPLIQNYSRLSYPFTALAGEIRDTGFSEGLIISNNRFLAGNMHFQFPNSRALIPDYNFEQLPYPPAFTRAAVIWKADVVPKIPVQLATFLKNSYNINWADYPVNYYEHPYKYNSSDTVKLGVLQFQLPKRDH
jgi:4-amino-4-deoxy-L-arabinose transferase-like glycosyltransferase